MHLNVVLNKKFEPGLSLENSIFVAWYILTIGEGEVHINPFNVEYFPQTDKDKEIVKFINEKLYNPNESINCDEPLEYIRKCNKGFNIFKSRQAQFIINQRNIPMNVFKIFPFLH